MSTFWAFIAILSVLAGVCFAKAAIDRHDENEERAEKERDFTRRR